MNLKLMIIFVIYMNVKVPHYYEIFVIHATCYRAGSRIFRRGGPILGGGFGLQRGHFSVKMYAKTKELGPVGGHAPARPPQIRLCVMEHTHNKLNILDHTYSEVAANIQIKNTIVDTYLPDHRWIKFNVTVPRSKLIKEAKKIRNLNKINNDQFTQDLHFDGTRSKL